MENDAIRDLLMNSPDIDSFVVSSSTLLKCIAENIVFYRSKIFSLSLFVGRSLWCNKYAFYYFFTQKSFVVLAKFFFYFIVLDHSILKQSLLSSSHKISDFSYFLRANILLKGKLHSRTTIWWIYQIQNRFTYCLE